jgi:hypothetical protein
MFHSSSMLHFLTRCNQASASQWLANACALATCRAPSSSVLALKIFISGSSAPAR